MLAPVSGKEWGEKSLRRPEDKTFYCLLSYCVLSSYCIRALHNWTQRYSYLWQCEALLSPGNKFWVKPLSLFIKPPFRSGDGAGSKQIRVAGNGRMFLFLCSNRPKFVGSKSVTFRVPFLERPFHCLGSVFFGHCGPPAVCLLLDFSFSELRRSLREHGLEGRILKSYCQYLWNFT